VNPSARTISNSDVANRSLFPTNNDDSRSAQTGPTLHSSAAIVRAAGGPPSRHHFEIVAG